MKKKQYILILLIISMALILSLIFKSKFDYYKDIISFITNFSLVVITFIYVILTKEILFSNQYQIEMSNKPTLLVNLRQSGVRSEKNNRNYLAFEIKIGIWGSNIANNVQMEGYIEINDVISIKSSFIKPNDFWILLPLSENSQLKSIGIFFDLCELELSEKLDVLNFLLNISYNSTIGKMYFEKFRFTFYNCRISNDGFYYDSYKIMNQTNSFS